MANTIERTVLDGDAGCRYHYFSNLLSLVLLHWYDFCPDFNSDLLVLVSDTTYFVSSEKLNFNSIN